MIPSNVLDAFADAIAARVIEQMSAAEPRNTVPQARLMDVAAAAEYLGVTEHSIRHQITKGQLPVVRRGSRVFVDRLDLDRQIDEQKESAVQ
jgi:excisionase family DNA binding protein